MADRVDVLGVLSKPLHASFSEMAEARAAVAELIEAAGAGNELSTPITGKPALRFGPLATVRLRAALARFGRESA